MPSSITPHPEIILSETDVEMVLEAQRRTVSLATKEDLPELIDALKSDRNDFWTRELISKPVAYLGGVEYLLELFDALAKNSLDGHDSDSLVHFLTEIASLNPYACRSKIEGLKDSSGFAHGNYADWLLGFCN